MYVYKFLLLIKNSKILLLESHINLSNLIKLIQELKHVLTLILIYISSIYISKQKSSISDGLRLSIYASNLNKHFHTHIKKTSSWSGYFKLKNSRKMKIKIQHKQLDTLLKICRSPSNAAGGSLFQAKTFFSTKHEHWNMNITQNGTEGYTKHTNGEDWLD